MPHLLKNEKIELLIDLPEENYKFSRFDWTGKIADLRYRGFSFSGEEDKNAPNKHQLGRGFYNEFGMDSPLGFEEAALGSYFHKIGIGLLKKQEDSYHFAKRYEIIPAAFELLAEETSLKISCTSEAVNGYAYVLEKAIELHSAGFSIRYRLENKGQKAIKTSEYAHNFLSFNQQALGPDFHLRFPFEIQSTEAGEIVNPENLLALGKREIQFLGRPKEVYFFSKLNGEEAVEAGWELMNQKTKLGIRERGDFKSRQVNLWGGETVISPELFFDIFIPAGESLEWSRTFEILDLS